MVLVMSTSDSQLLATTQQTVAIILQFSPLHKLYILSSTPLVMFTACLPRMNCALQCHANNVITSKRMELQSTFQHQWCV